MSARSSRCSPRSEERPSSPSPAGGCSRTGRPPWRTRSDMNGVSDAGAPAVVAEDLRKRYRLGEHRSLQQTINRLLRRGSPPPMLEALQGVHFTVYRGECFGIVGTNGSGKSTVLQILAGTTLPTGGMLEVTGRVLPLLSVGTGFHQELTGRENVMLFASSLGIPRSAIEDRMDRV